MSQQNSTRQPVPGQLPFRFPADPAAGHAAPSHDPQRAQPVHHHAAREVPDPATAPRDIFAALRPHAPAAAAQPRFEPYLPQAAAAHPHQSAPYNEHHGYQQSGYYDHHHPQPAPEPGAQPYYPTNPQAQAPEASGWHGEAQDRHAAYTGTGHHAGHVGYGHASAYPPGTHETTLEALRAQLGSGYGGQQQPATAYHQPQPGHPLPYQQPAYAAPQPYMPPGQGYHDTYGQPASGPMPGRAVPPAAPIEPAGSDLQEVGEAEERRGPRAAVIVGALLGAIALGGGLAYAYKSLMGPRTGKPPVVRADAKPPKAKPAEPGGRQIAHTDKKFLNRLGEEQPGASTGTLPPVPVSIRPPDPETRAGEGAPEGGPRRVQTLTVGRDGSITTSTGVPQPRPVAAAPAVPGMVIEGLAPAQPRPAPPPLPRTPEPAAAAEPPPAAQPPPRPAQRIAAAPAPRPSEPEVRFDPNAGATSSSPPARATPKRPAPARQAAVEPPPATDAAPAGPAAGGSGFVAVLSSRKSRMEALQAYADLQQKYADVLQNRTPDVREANLGAKGVWYRLVVGPPASQSDASAVCARLKQQGYTGCWVTRF